MFRLLKSGLPKDPVFPTDLEGLGFFLNQEDEVRMISNPRAYFDFFQTKNDRHNCVRREAMNAWLRSEILTRLTNLGLETVRLPLGAKETEAHVPILVSTDISRKKRVVILFYEHTQDLGVFAYRVVGGRGGINAGSAVNFVKYIQSLKGPNEEESPGIILANIGQLRWWRRGKRAVTQTSWYSLPQTSSAGGPYRFDLVKNTIPDNRTTAEHISYIFHHIVPRLLAQEATLQVIGVSVGAVDLIDFLNKPKNWEVVQPRLTALALVATFHQKDEINNPFFADFLRMRGRAYVVSNKCASTAIASSEGNIHIDAEGKNTRSSNCYGCPVFSLGEPHYSEMMLPRGYKTVLDWFQEVTAGGEGYENPEVIIVNPDALGDEAGEEIDLEEAKKSLVLLQGSKDPVYNAQGSTDALQEGDVDVMQTNTADVEEQQWRPADFGMANTKASEQIVNKAHTQSSKSEEHQAEESAVDMSEVAGPEDIPSKTREANTAEPEPPVSNTESEESDAKVFLSNLQKLRVSLIERATASPKLEVENEALAKEETIQRSEINEASLGKAISSEIHQEQPLQYLEQDRTDQGASAMNTGTDTDI